MPISCPLAIRSPSTDDFRDFDYAVMRRAFETHKYLGRLADEPICQAYFVKHLKESNFEVHREVPIDVVYETFHKQYFLDVVVNRFGVYEVKVASELTLEHEMQLLNYLLLLDLPRGKLINFRPQSVQFKFVNAPARRERRRRFQVTEERWTDQSCLRSKTLGFLRDWGTGLALPLYTQAATHFLGGEFHAIRNIRMDRDGYPLGRQRFHMTSENEAFRITALVKGLGEYESNLRKLLRHSALKAIHWINITLSEVRLLSVE
ncbi:GxxExxY protein [Stieleria sp. ICT_E10.1]|uniref:GxxExxY protein n=1 Tax=Stieleria sedimenti TaxID=2976331 RepID=UPI00218002F4|nr:GxxExxY protein [Stieleria sedimenti]MCS7471552.1 GxxExxY protein [Stieleria sedimenti]